MAKAKKTAAKKAAKQSNKKTPPKNKLTINLGNLELTEEQRKKLLAAVHETVESYLPASTTVQAKGLTRGAAMAATGGGSATITATFRNTDPGVSKLTATHNGEVKTITQSGTIALANVQKGEMIMVQGKSLGKADITIDREAEPPSLKFEPGIIAFNFFILS